MTIIDRNTLLKMNPENILLVDTRNVMGNEAATRELLFENPIKNTVHIPENPFIVEENGHNEGRSPIPTAGVVNALYDALSDSKKDIVLFTNDYSFFHTRLYVVFKLYGLSTKLYIGDIEALKQVAEKVEHVNIKLPTEFKENDTLPDCRFYTTFEEVKENINDPNHLLIDVRARNRYLGEGDNMDPKSGHIPTAVNIPNSELFVDGTMSLDVLQEELEYIKRFDSVTVSCGSGMSATPMFTFLNVHNIPVKLYGGSFSEWVKKDAPLETKENTLKERASQIE